MFELFAEKFGKPEERTGSSLVELGFPASPQLEVFGNEVGFGVFRSGLFSVSSLRERQHDLGGWERVLRADAKLFASSAFGLFLLSTNGENVVVLETQYGGMTESDMNIAEVLNLYVDDAFRIDALREPLFEKFGAINPTSVLCPTPVLALGGQWDILQEMPIAQYLAFTAGLVMPTVVEEQRRIFKEWQLRQADAEQATE